MKPNIHRLIWDSKILYEITEWLKNRTLDQKYIYLWEWAEKYYNYTYWFWGDDYSDELKNWKDLLEENIKLKENESINYISIACWNSLKEKRLMSTLKGDITYTGVDYSEEMIELSADNLKDVKFKTNLIRADIIWIDFKRYLDNLSKTEWKRVFLFLWNTFANIKTTNIVDTIWSQLVKWDIVCIDVTTKNSNDIKQNVEIFNHYKEKTTNNKLWIDFMSSSLKYINFPIEKWKFIIETIEDESIWTYKVLFSIEMLETIEFELESNVIISKWEKIKFLEVCFYTPEKFIDFMYMHKFKFIDNKFHDMTWYFIFEKM